MRRYALLYPEDVAGVVLVDPMRCEELASLDPASMQINRRERTTRDCRADCPFGLARLAVTSCFAVRADVWPTNDAAAIGGRSTC